MEDENYFYRKVVFELKKTKAEIVDEIAGYKSKIRKLEKELERYTKTVSIDCDLPFYKMGLNDRTQLYEYDKEVYTYFQDNPTETIADYNKQCAIGKEILLEV